MAGETNKTVARKQSQAASETSMGEKSGGRSTRTLTGKLLNGQWNVGAQHALYRETGDFYMPLKRFSDALFDRNGYVVFATREEYECSPHLSIGVRLDVLCGSVANIPGYVRVKP